MDIKKLTQEVLLKNMTQEQQLAVLESVQASVKEAKVVQKQKIAENVDLVLQALKRIEADMLKRVDGAASVVEDRVKTIKDGKDGKNGLDGKAGKDGVNGKDGKDGRDGRDGINGISGERGQDGVGVQNAHIDFDGSLIIQLTDGQELNVGEVVPFDVAEKIRVIGNGGGTSQYVIDALADLQTQINNVAGGLNYKGTWNASTNTPTLASSTGSNGWYYIVSVAGSTNLNGVTDWQVGDWAIFNGSTWQKIDQTNLVTSVNGNTGAVVLTASSVGALDTITSTDGSVTVSGTGTTRDLSVAVASSTYNVLVQVRNSTGATLTKGTVVYITGATGQLPTVSKAIATGDSTSAQTLGMITANLANNSNGNVTIIGLVDNLDTSAYTDGAQLYLSPTTAGTYTTTKSYAPDHLVYVGIVEHAHPTQGKIFVKVQNGYEMDELHNVAAQSPTTGQTIVWNGSTSLWEKNTVSLTAGVNGTLPVANGGTGSTTAAGALTNLGAYAASNPSGYTSNTGTVTSVSALTLGTTGTDLSSTVATGTTTPVITLNVPTASATNRGALSSTDWSTFNGKQAALVSGTNIKTVNSTSLLGSGDVAVQATLVSGTNIKTINSNSILGSGDLVISAAAIGTNTQVAYNNAGTMAGSANLTFNGTNLTCGGTVTANSDETLKTNWRDLPADFVEQLAKVKHGTYDRVDMELTQDGVSAQSLQSLLPNSVLKGEDGKLSVAYGNAALVAAIALAERVVQLEAIVKQLTNNK